MKENIGAKSIFLLVLLLCIGTPTVAYADRTVYITATGTHYHSTRSCRGLNRARNVYESTESNAISNYLTKCSLCWSGSDDSSYSSSSHTSTSSNSEQASTGNSTKELVTGVTASASGIIPITKGSKTQICKIVKYEVSDDGTVINIKLKNVGKKAFQLDPRCFVADDISSGFAWYDVLMDDYPTLKPGKSKTYSFTTYYGEDEDLTPLSLEEVEYDAETLGVMLYIYQGDKTYGYTYNPVKKINRVKIWESDSEYYKK